MSDLKGKIEKLNLNGSIAKKDGTTIDAIVLKLDSSDETIKISKNQPAGKFAEKLGLKVGDEVTLVRSGQYNSVTKIMKGSGFAKKPFTKSFEGKTFDGEGAKRGNAITNAVALLIHNHPKESITELHGEELETLAKLVFNVSSRLETKVENKKEEIVEVKTEDFAEDIDF